MLINKINRIFFIFFIIILLLYGFFILKHFYNYNRKCTIFTGQCGNNTYCSINGKCVEGNEGDSCFLGLAQCKRPFNCYPNFKCTRF